jgi:hypothetical protein
MKRLQIAILAISTALAPSCAVQATEVPAINIADYVITAPPTTTTIAPTTTTTVVIAPLANGKRCNKATVMKLAEYGLPADPFAYIAYRESRCNPTAINARWNKQGEMVYSLNKNGTWDSGLLQINSGHKERVRRICGKQALNDNLAGLLDIDCNLRVAADLYDNGKGLSHWRATHNQDK